jgi:ribosomal protein S18 acetylase RimI-like enzyme
VAKVLHRAGPDDLDELLALAREFCHLKQHAFDLDRVLAGLPPLLADDTLGQVWLVEDPEHPGERAGYAVLTWSWSLTSGGRECSVDELHVRARGNELATHVLAGLLDEAQAAGAVSVVLDTEAHDRRAREFFGAAGFDLTDSVRMSTRLPG